MLFALAAYSRFLGMIHAVKRQYNGLGVTPATTDLPSTEGVARLSRTLIACQSSFTLVHLTMKDDKGPKMENVASQ